MHYCKEIGLELTELENRAIEDNNHEIENSFNIKKGNPMPIEHADKQSVNPLFNKGTGFEGYNVNCQTCVPAYLLRLRGFNLTAGDMQPDNKSDYLSMFSRDKAGNRIYNCWECYCNYDYSTVCPIILHDWKKVKGIKSMSKTSYLEFLNLNTVEKGIYEFCFKFKNKSGGGHHVAVIHRSSDGNLYYLDPQIYDGENILIPVEDMIDLIDVRDFGGILRIDNKIIKKEFFEIFKVNCSTEDAQL